jgi:hypothetical protein
MRLNLSIVKGLGKQLLAADDTRQHDRDAQLNQTLGALAMEKRKIATPSQIIRELPQEIPLPAPIALRTSPAAVASSPPTANGHRSAANFSSTNNPKPAQAQVVIPAEDLKPLYDFTIDCKTCQAKLTAAQGDLANEKSKTKTATLTKERDRALQIARGGSTWRRISRAAKWFLIGAAAGAVVAKAAH